MEQILDSGKYDTVVFDCAPSYDYIASDFFEFICQKYNDSANRIGNVFVTTLEKSHVYTTISKVSNILKKSEYNLGIYVVCNDVTGYFNVYRVSVSLFYHAGGLIAPLGQTSAQEPHSMHVSGSMW